MKIFSNHIKGHIFNILKICGLSLIIWMFTLLVFFNFYQIASQHYVFLAKAFINGHLFFEGIEPFFNGEQYATDVSFWEGRSYWPLGPFPAIVLMPFVYILGTNILQGHLSIFFIVATFYLTFYLAKKFQFNKNNALWLSVFFIFGSAYLGLATTAVSWYFAHIIAVFLLLFALYEFFNKKRFLLIGILLGLSIATRGNYILAPIFFILMIFIEQGSRKEKLLKIARLTLPIIVIFSLLLLYNFVRFSNPFENGYGLQDVPYYLSEARRNGIFNIKQIPTNIYYFLFSGPMPALKNENPVMLTFPFIKENLYGMSILFTSPFFLYIFSASWRKNQVKAASITAIAMLCFVFLFFGIGGNQYGYRFAIDFYPFLYIILLNSALARNFNIKAKILIAISVIFNWYFVFT